MKLEGTYTALVTPMTDGRIDTEALARLVDDQIEAGISGLVPMGTTGEAATLSAADRFDAIKTTVTVAKGRVPVIAGAGANATDAAIEGSKLAADAGADALLHVTPWYNKPNQTGLLAHFGAIAEATDLPMVLYNVPGRTCCDMLPDTVAAAAALPGIVAIKEATGDLRRAAQVISAVPDGFSVLSGDDFTCMPFCAVGGHGVISVVSNLAPAETSQMIAAARAADLDRARELHYKLMPLMDLLFVESNPIPVKAGAALLGYGENQLNLPLVPLAGDGLRDLEAALRKLGRLGS